MPRQSWLLLSQHISSPELAQVINTCINLDQTLSHSGMCGIRKQNMNMNPNLSDNSSYSSWKHHQM